MKLELQHITSYIAYQPKIYYRGIVNGKELSEFDKKFKKAIGTGGLTSDIEREFEKIGARPAEVIDWKIGLLKKVQTYKKFWNVIVGNGHKRLHPNQCGSEWKLILHPLSDLTKEIEVNGEKFVPIIELNRRFNTFGWFNYSHLLSRGRDVVCLMSNNNNDIEVSEYLESISKLFEWHFDVFNLIQEGLAIDINTLK